MNRKLYWADTCYTKSSGRYYPKIDLYDDLSFSIMLLLLVYQLAVVAIILK